MPYRILHVQVSIKTLGFETHTGMEWSAVSWQLRLAFHKLVLSSWIQKVMTVPTPTQKASCMGGHRTCDFYILQDEKDKIN